MVDIQKLKILFSKDLDENVSNISKINSGLHNINFLIILENDKKCIARLAGPSNKGKFKKQSLLLDMISHKVSLPKLIKFTKHSDPKVEILYFEFVDGDEIHFDRLNSTQVTTLGKAVANIHSFHSEKYSPGPGRPATETGTLIDYVNSIFSSTVQEEYDRYRSSLLSQEHGKLINSAIDKALYMINDFPAEISQFSLLHTDIGYTNIIWENNKPFIIDWDDAMYGDVVDEVGYIFAINNSKEPFRKLFLEGYVSKSQENIASLSKRLNFYELKNRLFDVVWALSKLTPNSETLKNQNLNEYKLMYEKRYKDLELHLKNIL